MSAKFDFGNRYPFDNEPDDDNDITDQNSFENKQEQHSYINENSRRYTPKPAYESEEYNEDEYDPEVLEKIRLAKIRREKAAQLAKDRLHAEMILVGAALLIVALIVTLIIRAGKNKDENTPYSPSESESSSVERSDEGRIRNNGDLSNSNNNTSTAENTDLYEGQAEGHQMTTQNGVTYIDGILIVNKTFSLPNNYDPGLSAEAEAAFNDMAAQAWSEGITLWICSGYRSYSEQETLFNGYAYQRGLEDADEVSARPGHSEHQSGLCMDVNTTDFSFTGTAEAIWLEQHCAEYGFIIRFPEGKESITGYAYEPWHIRYVGVETAQQLSSKGMCLEEYLNVTSDYNDSPENEMFKQRYSMYEDSSSAEEYGQNEEAYN